MQENLPDRRFAGTVEVNAANGVDIMIAEKDEYTPTTLFLMLLSIILFDFD